MLSNENKFNLIEESKGIRSKKIYDTIKAHGGFNEDDYEHNVADMHNLTDNDYVGILPFQKVWGMGEYDLNQYARERGFDVEPGDQVSAIRLGDNNFLLVIVRNGKLYQSRNDGWKNFYDKQAERMSNRRKDGADTYQWNNQKARELFKNPYFRKWPKDERQSAIANAKRQISETLRNAIINKLNEGAWGYNADQCDKSLDELDTFLFKTVKLCVDETKKPKNADDAWANICIINTFLDMFEKTKNEADIPDELLDAFSDNIDKCTKDKEWIKYWRKPEKIIASLTKYRKQLEDWRKKDRIGEDSVKIQEKKTKSKLTEALAQAIEDKLESARREVNVTPTEPQKKANNYAHGHISINGFQISIENPKGSYRSGKDKNGKPWKVLMHNDYGYFTKTVGKDGDAIDVFIGDNFESSRIFAIDQRINGKFDETKIMFCFNTMEQAKKAYLSNYNKDWKGFWKITETDIDTFKKWLYDGYRQRKPFAEYVIFNK